ncbi:phytoene desaturase family protein [Amycolatopsis jejuensis]|uniref:phytoene desaturase family protein n=1 Tax=Amycolatopsis jejuensis TaxID=330084 RepID=UPI000527CC47|nr:NAD(P)/FAD-dependent oxidoreductase [Amycolatopsis jejuensis]
MTDAVVVGAGINGIAAAATLAKAGWSVTLVDDHDRIGGFIATGERTVPGYRHDTFSSWHPLFVTGPVYAEFGADLHRHGLEYLNTDGPMTATVSDDGSVVMGYRSVEETVAGFSVAADRRVYADAVERFGKHAQWIGGLLGAELRMPSMLKPLAAFARGVGRRGVEEYARDALTSGRGWLRSRFTGPEVDRLWTPWLLHAGLAPDSASGGLMLPVLAGTLHAAGMPVVRGGAANFVAAWEKLLAELGVEIRTGHRVERILTTGGRASGVAGEGFTIEAKRAVLASTTPGALYRELLADAPVPPRIRDQATKFRPGRAATQIHVALSGPVPWRDPRLAQVPLVHLSDGASSTGIACAEAEAGLLPGRPTVVVGQQHVLDPSRVPAGAAALWLQLQEVPYAPVGDAAGELSTADGWDAQLTAGYADRVLARIERQAPGLRDLVLGLDAISPADLAAANLNAVGGDPYGGSAELDQNFRWRPLAASPGHATVLPRLWHLGASTHPGPGLGGGSGHLVASRVLRRLR